MEFITNVGAKILCKKTKKKDSPAWCINQFRYRQPT